MQDSSIFVSASNNSLLNQPGTFLGNGKVGIITSNKNNIDVDRTVITRDVQYKNGTYQPNVLDVFNTCRISVFDNIDYTTVETELISHQLMMKQGTMNSVYEMTHLVDGSKVSIAQSLYCVRHLPYSIMQTLEITPLQLSGSEMNIFHEVYTKDNIVSATFENPVKYTQNGPLYQFVGSGKTQDNVDVGFTTSYLFDGQVSCHDVEPLGLGFSHITDLKNYQFNAFKLKGLAVGIPFRIHIFTTTMTSNDFNDPRTESISVSTHICSQIPIYPSQTVASFIRSSHTSAWDKLWKTKVNITAKIDASPDEKNEVTALNKLLNSSLYYIYSCLRENFNLDINGNSVSIIDIDGNLLYDSDIWLVPLLLIIRPSLARPLIEYRFKALGVAQTLAASYGFTGAKYPYLHDAIGYKSNVYYTTTSFMHLFNTAMVAVNAWNYYRASRDRDWLREKGYPIIKNVAIFLVNIVERDPFLEEYTIRNVMGLNGVVSESNNLFTNNLVKMAMRYAIEASYELKYDIPDAWFAVCNGIKLPKFPAPNQNVGKFDDQWVQGDTCDILESCFMFTPSYWQMVYTIERVYWVNVVHENNAYWASTISNGNEYRPTNLALQAIMTGVYMSQYPSSLSDYMTFLNTFVDRTVFGPWLAMYPDLRILNNTLPYNSSAVPGKNSLTTNALFILMILQGVCQAHLVGGISDTRFYYEDLKVSVLATATMPSYWAFISLDGIGMEGSSKTYDIRQNGVATNYTGPNIDNNIRNRGIIQDEFNNTP
jgi:protein-glucosylgalactosylhydroxylysine glucosidase